MERTSSVCIRFEQLREPRQDARATKTRHQIRSQLVEVLNEIQHVCGTDTTPFEVTDVSYAAHVNKENKLEGLITIQKRMRKTLEDDKPRVPCWLFTWAMTLKVKQRDASGGVR